MSLTAHLLLNKPIRLPEGTVRRIGMEMQSAQEEKLEVTRARILDAIRLGFTTISDLADETGLSIKTIKSRIHDLEDLGRVTWTIRENCKKVFEVVR